MISPKQKKILAFPYSRYDALICDGAVRSGKTSLMVLAFIDWAMREFDRQRFGICGKTVKSAAENMITPYLSMRYAKKRYTLRWRSSKQILEVRQGRRVNYFEVFGGRDESSFALIQGRTLAGVLLDEVVLMPESFVNQALARCSVEGARMWFSCNPGNPSHWFKKEWIDKRKERGALYLHFEMTDKAGERDDEKKHYNIALRRMREGQCFHQPCLGCREFPAQFRLVEDDPPAPLPETRDLGYMLYDMDFRDPENIQPIFFRARMENGVVDLTDCEVVR